MVHESHPHSHPTAAEQQLLVGLLPVDTRSIGPRVDWMLVDPRWLTDDPQAHS